MAVVTPRGAQRPADAPEAPAAAEGNNAALHGSMPDGFIHDFGSRAASLSVLLHVLSVIETTEPLDASQGSIHHLCALAGTIGLPGLSDLPSHAQTAPRAQLTEAGKDKSAA